MTKFHEKVCLVIGLQVTLENKKNFTFNIAAMDSASKPYSSNYKDALWIRSKYDKE